MLVGWAVDMCQLLGSIRAFGWGRVTGGAAAGDQHRLTWMPALVRGATRAVTGQVPPALGACPSAARRGRVHRITALADRLAHQVLHGGERLGSRPQS